MQLEISGVEPEIQNPGSGVDGGKTDDDSEWTKLRSVAKEIVYVDL